MNIVAIIQARVASRRLYAKVLRDIEGKPMLWHVVNRVKSAKLVDDIVLAITTDKNDDAIVKLCDRYNWKYHRGITGEVLKQFYDISLLDMASVVVRITGDCPLIDAKIIDKTIERFMSNYPDVDYGSNLMPRTYPRGLDVEVVNVDTLDKVKDKGNSEDREHVTLYIRQHPEEFRIVNVSNDVDYSYIRWTVDTAEDLGFVRKVYHHFQDSMFGWGDVIGLLEEHPWWVIRDTTSILEKQ